MNLRERAVIDAKSQNLKNWALPIELIDPDGIVYNIDNETGEILKALQILYDRRSVNPDTGEIVIVHEPVVTVARSSLSRIPKSDENWYIKFPEDPTDPDTLTGYVFTPDRALEGGNSLGIMRIYPQEIEQS